MATSNIRITKCCEGCGAEFQAQKVSTRFCSHRCASLANKEAKRQERIKQAEYKARAYVQAKSMEEVKAAELLSFKDAAKLIGVTRQAVYAMVALGKLKAYRISSRLSRIRRTDIDAMLDARVYCVGSDCKTENLSAKEREEITEFYTTKEVLAKFSISNSWLFKMAKDKNIPKTIHLGKTMWSKSHCDRIFGQKSSEVDEITEWYSAAEICEKFGMTLSQVYTFINSKKIPKKKVGNVTSYSKKHVDIAKGIAVADEQRWYSYAEAMERYSMSRDQVGHYINGTS
jgi:excisionase family DNA binding protein